MNTRSFLKVVLEVTALSVVGNAILTVIGRAVSHPPATFGPYMYSSVIGLTVGGVVAAAIVYYVMRKRNVDLVRTNRQFIILSVIVLIVSFYPDIAMPWSTDADQVGWTYGIIVNLMLMHVIPGGLVMYYFTRPNLA